MLAFAFRFDFLEVCLKAFMLQVFVLNREAVDAFLVRGMVAGLLDVLDVLLGDSEAVDALGFGSMVAVRLLDLLLGFWLIGLLLSQGRLLFISNVMILFDLHLLLLALLGLLLNNLGGNRCKLAVLVGYEDHVSVSTWGKRACVFTSFPYE